MPNLYCIIATYNGENHIHECLNSLRTSNYLHRVVIVDNNSQDDTIKIIQTEYPEVELIKLEYNVGFGKANNIGIKYAYEKGADYFFLLNQDAYVQENTFSELVYAEKRNVGFGILSPLHLNGNGDHFDYLFSKMALPSISSSIILDFCFKSQPKDVYSCGFVNAAAWLVTRKCIDEVGIFDPLFHHYGEDEEYINRVLARRILVGISPSTHIRHNRGINNKLSTYPSHYQKKVRILIQLKNIQHPYYRMLRMFVSILLSDLIKGLVLLRFAEVSESYVIIKYIITNYKTIKEHRDITKTEKIPFMGRTPLYLADTSKTPPVEK